MYSTLILYCSSSRCFFIDGVDLEHPGVNKVGDSIFMELQYGFYEFISFVITHP